MKTKPKGSPISAKPPVYQPHSSRNILQRKAVRPVAPAVYRPNSVPRVLQAKGITVPGAKTVSPLSRPSQLGVLQRHPASRIIQRAAGGVPPPAAGGGGVGAAPAGGGGAAVVPAGGGGVPAAAAAAAPAMVVAYSDHWDATRRRRPEWTADVEANDDAVARRIFAHGQANASADDTRYAVNYQYQGQYFIVIAFYHTNGLIRFHTVFMSPRAQAPDGGGVTLRPRQYP